MPFKNQFGDILIMKVWWNTRKFILFFFFCLLYVNLLLITMHKLFAQETEMHVHKKDQLLLLDRDVG